MKKLFFIILICIIQKLFSSPVPYFYVPHDWEMVDPKHYSDLIKISFVKNQKTFIRPSINLAIQKTSLTLNEYVNIAKQNHMADSQTNFIILDKTQLKQGEAIICKIDKTSESLDLDMLQMIFIKDEYAYVLTGATKKNDMVSYYKMFMKSFLSFELVDDVFLLISNQREKKDLLLKIDDIKSSSNILKKREKQKKLKSFEKYLDKKFQNLGKYFQILVFQNVIKNKKG